jgi:hypothetical protein
MRMSMATPPRPPPARRIEIPLKALMLRKDPTYEQDKRNEPEYEFPHGRVFMSRNSNKRGPYNPD